VATGAAHRELISNAARHAVCGSIDGGLQRGITNVDHEHAATGHSKFNVAPLVPASPRSVQVLQPQQDPSNAVTKSTQCVKQTPFNGLALCGVNAFIQVTYLDLHHQFS